MIDWTSWMDYGFMKMALAAILIITPLFGLMGTMIVNKKNGLFFGCPRAFCTDGNCRGRRMWDSGYEYFHGDFCGCIRAVVKQNRKQKYRINRYDYFGFFFLFGCHWSGNPVKRGKFQ